MPLPCFFGTNTRTIQIFSLELLQTDPTNAEAAPSLGELLIIDRGRARGRTIIVRQYVPQASFKLFTTIFTRQCLSPITPRSGTRRGTIKIVAEFFILVYPPYRSIKSLITRSTLNYRHVYIIHRRGVGSRTGFCRNAENRTRASPSRRVNTTIILRSATTALNIRQMCVVGK